MTDLIAWLIATPFIAILFYLALELSFGIRPLRAALPVDPGLRLAILIPAHDEAGGIAETVEALRRDAPSAQILVVADNCSDATAALARGAGAEVVEREDALRHGKGFALAFGRDRLAVAAPDAVLVLDADCRIAPGGAERLAAEAVRSGRPVQAANLLVAPAGASPLVSISNFAMLIKNLVRARGLVRLGGGGLLFGTGMAFPWSLFSRLSLATDDMVEDLALGLQLAREGVTIGLADGVRVTSPAAGIASSRGQRARWEHGFLATATKQAAPLLVAGVLQRSRHLVAIGCHLLVPPIALLMMAAAMALLTVSILNAVTGHFIPAVMMGTALSLIGGLLFVAWWREARALLPWTDLARAPLYMLWKIPIYLAFFGRRQTRWNRTERDPN